MSWSGSEGARLTILGALAKKYVRPPQPELTVHGRAAADGAKVTLPTALLTSATFGSGLETKFVDSTLLCEGHVSARTQNGRR